MQQPSSILLSLPNWNRFSEKYNPDIEFIEAFNTRIVWISDPEIQKKILDRINVELWILLLHDTEVDSTFLESLTSIFSEK
mgnify:FL=1